MTLTACPECGTQVVAGTECPLCGTPTPAPPPAPPPLAEAPVRPVPGAAPPPSPSMAAMDTGARYANQWEVLLERVRGAVAPKYTVERILGWGGMAGVYLANEPRLGRRVAIKVMSPGLMVDPQLVERFSQEARTIAQFNHPHIVTIYEVDERDGLHYFTMTYVAGRTLGQVMTGTDGPLPIDVVRAWLYQIGDGLGYAHHHGVVHRDIKPGNVLLDVRGNALVTDFGIAKVTDEPGLTRTGMLVGTPAYMSPEQCSSGQVTGASDQYSLGAVAYQMLTGQPPFSGPTLSVLQAHVAQDPRPIRELRPDCPDDLVAAVQRMLEKKPADRWPSMSSAIAAAGGAPPGLDGPIREQMSLLAAQAATVAVAPWFDVVREGTLEDVSPTVSDAGGRMLEGRRVEWRSADPLVASVSNGRLRAVTPGTTTLDAFCGGAITTLTLTVEADPVPSVEVEPVQAVVAAGARIPLDVIVNDWDGARLDERAVLWSSSDSTIARVSPEGVVEGLRPGEVVINASTGGKAAAATVTVTTASALAEPVAPGGATHPDATLRPSGKSKVSTKTPAPKKTPTPKKTPVPKRKPVPSGGGSGAGAVVGVGDGATDRFRLPAVIAGIAVIAMIGYFIVRGLGGGTSTGIVQISGELPAGATIAAIGSDGRSQTVSGTTIELEPGSYTFSFTAPDYDGYSGMVDVLAGDTSGWAPIIAATPTFAASGTLEIGGTLPADASLTLVQPDGSSRPLTVGAPAQLEPGTYEIAFTAPGFQDFSEPVEIVAGSTVAWTPELTEALPPPPTSGTLRIAGNLPASATIRVRDAAGSSRIIAGSSVTLAPGRYTIEFSAAGYESDTDNIQIRAGQPATWTPTLRTTPAPQPTTGTLQISRASLPAGATITLRQPNGQTRNVTGSSLDLPPGTYTLEFSAPGYAADQRTVDVRVGATARWAPTINAVRPDPPPDNPPPPTTDPAADRAAIETAVRGFVDAFNRRNVSAVVPLMPSDARDRWKQLLENRSAVTDFSAQLASIEPATVNGDAATVLFTLQIRFESGNARQSPTLSYVGTMARGASGWNLVSLAQGR